MTKTLSDFLNQDFLSPYCGVVGRKGWDAYGCDAVVHERLVSADVGSLKELLRWYRERYPDKYRLTYFEDEGGAHLRKSGRQNMEMLWADYLLWVEG